MVRRSTSGGRELAMVRWGLVPAWSKGRDSRYSMINARAKVVSHGRYVTYQMAEVAVPRNLVSGNPATDR